MKTFNNNTLDSKVSNGYLVANAHLFDNTLAKVEYTKPEYHTFYGTNTLLAGSFLKK